MITIRPYEKKDFRYVQDICMQTSAFADDDNAVNRAVLCALYCDYYLDNEPQFCFVAVDDDNVPVGYVLSSANVELYDEAMADYLQLVRKLSSSEYFRFNAELKLNRRYISDGYSAHLHINVLPEHRGCGIGTQLIAALEKRLAEVPVDDVYADGLFVVVGKKNDQARAFYEKCGFEDIDYITGSVVYGKRLLPQE